MSHVTTDHDTIRRWAEKHGGKPAAVEDTQKRGDAGIIRIMFPKAPNSETGNLAEIGWDDFFEKFEESNLALIYDPRTMFNQIVDRSSVEERADGAHKAAG